MPLPTFIPRITYGNPSLLPSGLGIRPPAGMPAGAMLLPNYVSPAELVRLRSSQQDYTSGSLAITHALVAPIYTMNFEALRWQTLDNGRVRFVEGAVRLDLNLTIYMDRNYPHNSENRFIRGIFAEIMNHELEHMADEINVVTEYMPGRLARHHVTHQCFEVELTTLMRDFFITRGHYLQQTHNTWQIERSRQASGRHESSVHQARLGRIRTLMQQMQTRH